MVMNAPPARQRGQRTLEAPLHNYDEEYNVMEPTLGNKFDNF